MLFGSFALFIIAMIFGKPFSGSLDLSLQGWGALLFLALPGGALMMWCFISGFRLVTPTQAAIAVGCNPLTAILFAAWILSEPVGWGSAVGFALVTIAVLCANKKGRVSPSFRRNLDNSNSDFLKPSKGISQLVFNKPDFVKRHSYPSEN